MKANTSDGVQRSAFDVVLFRGFDKLNVERLKNCAYSTSACYRKFMGWREIAGADEKSA